MELSSSIWLSGENTHLAVCTLDKWECCRLIPSTVHLGFRRILKAVDSCFQTEITSGIEPASRLRVQKRQLLASCVVNIMSTRSK
jgi:hypothetical protein